MSGKKRGFSLMELMIALGIIATSLLLIILTFTTILRASQKTIDLTAGTIYAEEVMDRTIYNILDNPVAKTNFFNNPKPFPGPAYQSGTSSGTGTVFTYLIYTDLLQDPIPVGQNRLMKIDVIVWWWDQGGGATQGKQGFGFLRTELSRLVNENSKY